MGTTLHTDAGLAADEHPSTHPSTQGTCAARLLTPPLDTTSRAGRRARFEAETIPQLGALYRFALSLTRSRDQAQDLVSDTVLRAFDRWEQYRLGSNVRAWLFTILYHTFVSRKRSLAARREVPLPDDADSYFASETDEAASQTDPEGGFYDSFLDEEITRAIDALPADYRTAVVLSDVQGLRYAEIAEILGIPEGTVKSRLFRGRRILQKKLVGYAVDMGYVRRVRAAA